MALARRQRVRGFTLIELMVVVVIVAILASIAIPGVIERLRERRANQTAQEIAILYRNARLRALGHGSAVLVHYDSTNGFSVREAIGVGGTCTAQPVGGCATNNWALAANYRVVDQSNPFTGPNVDAGVVTQLKNPAGTAQPSADVCFTPRGRTFEAEGASALSQLSSVLTVEVSRVDPHGTQIGNFTRVVTVPPNGIARVAL